VIIAGTRDNQKTELIQREKLSAKDVSIGSQLNYFSKLHVMKIKKVPDSLPA